MPLRSILYYIRDLFLRTGCSTIHTNEQYASLTAAWDFKHLIHNTVDIIYCDIYNNTWYKKWHFEVMTSHNGRCYSTIYAFKNTLPHWCYIWHTLCGCFVKIKWIWQEALFSWVSYLMEGSNKITNLISKGITYTYFSLNVYRAINSAKLIWFGKLAKDMFVWVW